MKVKIHPTWYESAKVTCACGNVFTLGAAVPSFNVEVCSACHPFYTGKEKLVDTAGRVDKFKKRAAKAATTRPSRNKRLRK